MKIVICNGDLSIKGSVADKKAFASVAASLDAISDHAGGELAECADLLSGEMSGFLDKLEACDDFSWAAERVKTETTS